MNGSKHIADLDYDNFADMYCEHGRNAGDSYHNDSQGMFITHNIKFLQDVSLAMVEIAATINYDGNYV